MPSKAGKQARDRAAPRSVPGPGEGDRPAFERGDHWFPQAALVLILVAATVLHARSVSAPFFADDYLFLDQVRDRSLWGALTSQDPIGNFFRPVGRQLWFWLVGHMSGQSAAAFHLANLGLFLAALSLLYAIVRRIAGPRAAAVAAGFVALRSAADVPLLWSSGSQDLLAMAAALAAIWLHLSDRRVSAGGCLLLALLSKETVVLAPFVAVLLDRRHAESWWLAARRGWPLGLATGVWAALWISHRPTGIVTPGDLWSGPPAALAHLVQVATGLEWRSGGPHIRALPQLLPVALVLVGVLAASATPGVRMTVDDGLPTRRPVALYGLAWAALGALPVAAVAPIWSGYYYLFALCGMGLAIGACVATLPRAVGAGVVAALAWGAEVGRSVDEFQTSPASWSTLSHVNRFYIDRATPQIARYLKDLKAARPTLPRNSTVFFGTLPSFIGFQAGDGPLVRWAYQDSSLRSYFVSSFSPEKASRGPVMFLIVSGDSLIEARGPEFFTAFGVGAALDDHPVLGRDVLRTLVGSKGANSQTLYLLGVIQLSCPDTSGAAATLARAGVTLTTGPAPGLGLARAMVASGDTVGAIGELLDLVRRHGGDPDVHALLADLSIRRTDWPLLGFVEALAARALAPNSATAWRRVGFGQVSTQHYLAAQHSLERYFQLAGRQADDDHIAHDALVALREVQPGGRLAQEALH